MTLHSKCPPAVQVLFWAIIAFGLAHYFQSYPFPVPLFFVAASALVGTVFLALALIDFRKHSTTINPLDVTKVSTLVTGGPYRITRNPMYVGLAFLLLAWCLYLAELAAFVTVPLFLATMTVFQIKAEESFLIVQFGDEYRQYMNRVTRWLFF